jgi:hypothetical protein
VSVGILVIGAGLVVLGAIVAIVVYMLGGSDDARGE